VASAPVTKLPLTIVDRPKTGFGVPTGRWIAELSSVPNASKGAASRAWAREVVEQHVVAVDRERKSEIVVEEVATT